MLTDPRQLGAVLDEARHVAERESKNRAGTPTPEVAAGAAAPTFHPAPVAAVMAGSHQPSPPVARCKSCNALVYWAVTGTGAAMPVDVEPRADGNLSLRWNGQRVLAVYVSGDSPGPRRASHFASCPKAADHRRVR